MKEIKVVTGAGYGDEGKGLVSYALAHEAVNKGNKVLTVFANGTIQRAHTVNDRILHCIGAGDLVGGSTYYWPSFVIYPFNLPTNITITVNMGRTNFNKFIFRHGIDNNITNSLSKVL